MKINQKRNILKTSSIESKTPSIEHFFMSKNWHFSYAWHKFVKIRSRHFVHESKLSSIVTMLLSIVIYYRPKDYYNRKNKKISRRTRHASFLRQTANWVKKMTRNDQVLSGKLTSLYQCTYLLWELKFIIKGSLRLVQEVSDLGKSS